MWEIPKMNAVKVDDTRRVRLPMLAPGDYYVPEPLGGDSILLHKVPPPRRQMSKAEVLVALEESPIRFKIGWDRLKPEVR
jgi:hypothetical protein